MKGAKLPGVIGKHLKLGISILFLLGAVATHAQSQYCDIEAQMFNWQGPCNDSVVLYITVNDTTLSYFPNFEFYVNWGDGTVDTFQPTSAGYYQFWHEYVAQGIYFPFIILLCGDTVVPYETECWILPGRMDSAYICDTSYYINIAGNCVNVSGFAYVDVNGNCAYDSMDYALTGSRIIVSDLLGNVLSYGYVYPTGMYSLSAPASGSYVLEIDPGYSGLITSCGSSDSVVLSGSSSYDFVFTCSGNSFDLQLSVYAPAFTQVNPTYVDFVASNISCSQLQGDINIYLPANVSPTGTVFFTHNGVGITPSYSFNGNVLTISGFTFNPGDVLYGRIGVLADTTVNIGDTLCVSGEILPVIGDVDSTNNRDESCGEVLVSYDPNDKRVFINGRSAEGYIEPNQEMLYVIRFQNLGTYYARRVVIVNTLDHDLDISSFKLRAFSHDVKVINKGNVVWFIFDDIWLPSADMNEPASHGFVAYTINQKPNLPEGTHITNFADIYFDFNQPVRTNTVVSIIGRDGEPTSVYYTADDIMVKVFPNPSSGIVNIYGKPGELLHLELYDHSGKLLATHEAETGVLTLNMTEFTEGIYVIRIMYKDKTNTIKLRVSR